MCCSSVRHGTVGRKVGDCLVKRRTAPVALRGRHANKEFGDFRDNGWAHRILIVCFISDTVRMLLVPQQSNRNKQARVFFFGPK